MSDTSIRQVRFLDLSRGLASSREEIDAAVARVLDSSWFVLGTEVEEFERELASACTAAHAVGVGSGTDAIEIALRALDIGAGDEVVTQANTCVPTVAAIVRSGATPALSDVDPETATMDPESVRGVLSARTRAVIPVHLYGQCADMEAIAGIAADHGLAVVEDCAQALGARSRGKPAGAHGTLAAFSFYPTKMLGALGDAGAVVTSDRELAARARRIRQYGVDGERSVEQGVNSRLDELQAAILRAKLPLLERWGQRRRELAERYDRAFAATPIRPLARIDARGHVFQLYVVRVPERDAFRRELGGLGVETRVHYSTAIHQQAAYLDSVLPKGGLRGAEQLAREVVSLPLYPELSDDEVDHVISAALSAVAGS